MSKLSFVVSSLSNIIYITVLVIPNFFLGSSWTSIVLLSFVYLFLYSIFSLKVFYIITGPLLLLSLIQFSYYTNINPSLVSAHLIEISLFQSNWNERMSILIDYIIPFICCLIILIFVWKSSKKITIPKTFNLLLLTVIILISLFTIYSTKESTDYKRKHIDNAFHFKTITLLNTKNIFPLNFIRNTWTAYLTHKKSETYLQNTKNFNFDYPQLDNSDREIIILVIGESSRASSFGLNNANVTSTPLLQKRNNLVSFKNAFSPYSSTSRSVPFSLSRVPLDKWKERMYTEKSILTAMKELGYSTFCIDNQAPNRGLLDYYKKEADYYVSTKKPMSYDQNIVPIVDSIVKHNMSPKKFILIHTYGSHYTYSSRYPKSMAKFTPDHYESMDIKFKKEITNAYLNTIHYVDFFLDEIIQKIESYKSSIIYYSDHGENIYDDDQNLILHGYTNPNEHTLNIPLIVWISDAKREDDSNLITAAILNRDKIVSTKSLFPSILSFAPTGEILN